MSQILLPVLYCLAGFCAYAAVHHGLIALGRPAERTHFLFALLATAVTLYVIAGAAAYRADSALTLVAMRRWQVSLAMVIFGVLPWFVGFYTGVRPHRLLVGLSVSFAVGLVANLALPYGISFVELPRLEYLALPWGEQVVDVRVHQRGIWHNAMWLVIFVCFGYALAACVRQYRRHRHERALMLGLALGVFLVFVLGNFLVNRGLVEFTHTGEFGFVALVAVMSFELLREPRENQRRMQAILDHVPADVYVKDLDGRYLLSNRRHESSLHAANDSVRGKTDHDFLPAPEADGSWAADQRVLASGLPEESEGVRERHGERRSYLTLKFPLLDATGAPYAVCSVSTDVTALRDAQHEMESLRQQIWHDDRVERVGVLVASLAHELAQPLTAIRSNAQAGVRFLAAANPDLNLLREILEDIVRDDGRASGLIDRLRAMLRREDAPRKRIDLGDCVTGAVELLRNELRARRVEVSYSIAESHTAVASKSQIQQVILNLVMNAAESMAELPDGERRLWISLSRDGERPLLAVRDSGSGIPQDHLEKVFDKFYTTKAHGLGMGLAVCRSIVEAHGGTIWAEPNAERGTTFLFTLPS
jgi:signal transduction histidine kinase